MTAILWDKTGERLYETGISKGVLYIPNASGVYENGYGWNGLTAVTESPSGAEPTKQYADNRVYLTLMSAEEFSCTLEAFMSPPEFDQCDGTYEPTPGIAIGQQNRKSFGLSYRTEIGNDLEGTSYGYKIHLVYGCTAAPSEKAYATINDSPEAAGLSWEISTTPVEVTGRKPTATLVVNSTLVDGTVLAALEDMLYGTVATDANLPLPDYIIAMFEGTITEVTPTAPTYNSTTDIVTIPSVTGVVYSVDGEVVPSGSFGPITESIIVTAAPAVGYSFTAISDNDWVITFA